MPFKVMPAHKKTAFVDKTNSLLRQLQLPTSGLKKKKKNLTCYVCCYCNLTVSYWCLWYPTLISHERIVLNNY